MHFIPAEIIQKKKLGLENDDDEINYLIQSYSKGEEVENYHMAAWAMAIYFKGMSPREIATLTNAMKESGKTFDFSKLGGPRIDKHSTGGVGDKTSLIIGPIMAANGIYNPMIAGRGLGHTGGTLDKLESIPGFDIQLSEDEFYENIKKHYFSIMGQTNNICPADKKLYALRDVTSTVDSLPLICGSIMSKKLAENLTGLVLDVKFGSGAFMKTQQQAEELALLLQQTGQRNGLQVSAFITSMNQPLGKFIGNSLEVFECLEILEGKTRVEDNIDFYEPTKELSLQLSAEMIRLAGKAKTNEQGYEMALASVKSGTALKKFLQLCEYQGPSDPYKVKISSDTFEVTANLSGFVSAINTEKIGLLSVELGAGRLKSSDKIDHSVGLEMHISLGAPVRKGQKVATVYFNKNSDVDKDYVKDQFLKALTIESTKPKKEKLIAKILT